MTELQRQQTEADFEYYAKRAQGKNRSMYRTMLQEYTESLKLMGYNVEWDGGKCHIKKEVEG